VIIGVREQWWPTVSAFEQGVAEDRGTFHELLARPGRGFTILTQTERVI
jgi:hypothetical protein